MKNEMRVERMYGLENHAPVMRDAMKYKLTWKDEDTNRVSSNEFTGQDGEDHSAFDDAFAMASVVDGNLWPWVIERDGEQIAHGWVVTSWTGAGCSRPAVKKIKFKC